MTGRLPLKRTLFLDCDGVLADFDGLALQLFGMTPRLAEKAMSEEEFWLRIKQHGSFFRDLAVLPEGRKLFDAVAHTNPIILTGCHEGIGSEPQKLEWGVEHFPGTSMICCLSRNKYKFMKPGDILVDDYLKYRDL